MIASFSIPEVFYGTEKEAPAGAPFLAFGLNESDCLDGGGALPSGAAAAGALVTRRDFRGKRLETTLLYPDGKGPERLFLIGLGDPTDLDVQTFRRLGAKAGRKARELRVSDLAIQLPPESGADVVAATAQGAVLGALRARKSDEEAPPVEKITVYGGGGSDEAILMGVALAEATLYARMLITEPPNRLYPATLAEEAGKLSEEGASVRVLQGEELEKEGLHALIAVGQGSIHPPRFIVAEYDGSGGKGPAIALVGKGITFDSGGLSLKSADRMVHMKYDMAGSAVMLAAFRGAMRLKLPLRLGLVIPAAENMPSAGAYRPGDVVSSYSGKTIEVDNTDAEGRIILADGLAWAEKNLAPDEMIDAATLTGACRIALGRHAAGLFSNEDVFAARLIQSGRYSGERLWQLPLWDEYDKELESDVAVVKNVGKAGHGGGASIAASFLRRFVGSVPWAHIDIAGMAWAGSAGDLRNAGPSGFGAGLVLTYLMERSGRSLS